MSNLTILFDGTQGGQAANIVNIIILPEIRTRTPKQTVNSLVRIEPSSRIFELCCDLSPDDPTIWASLIQKANDLLELILQQPHLWNDPLVFVCHGLSGIVAKRTLGILDERYYDDKLKLLLDIQSGIVFLATPHLTFSKRNRWHHLNTVLKSCPGFSNWQSQNEIATIANVCTKFEDAQIENPILSVYEVQETKIREDETLVAAEANHREIIAIDTDDDLCRHLVSFFSKIHSRRQALGVQTLQKGVQRLSVAADEDDKDSWASAEHQPIGKKISSQDEEEQSEGVRHASRVATMGTVEATLPDSALVDPSDFLKLRRPVQLPCFFLCSYIRNSDFSGRDDILARMDDVLLPTAYPNRQNPTGPRTFVISGLGGVGKTQCALEYAISRKDKFDAVLWAHADTSPKLDESFSQISVALGLEHAAKAGDRVVSRNLVLEWLSNPRKSLQPSLTEIDPTAQSANWLLIFDNADDPSVLADFWPSSGVGSIVVTSRDPLARKYISSHGVDLEPLTAESAATLLRKLTKAEDTTVETETSIKVAKRMGGLPLAISLAAAAILRQELTFEEFLAFYEIEPSSADVKPISLKPETQYQHTLSTVWALETLEKPAECLLRLLSVLDPDGVDEKIITQKMQKGLPRGYPDSTVTFINARTSLLKSSLVKRDKATSQLSIHRLTQDFTRAKMSFTELKEYFEAGIEFCMQYWPIPEPAFSYVVKDWPQCQTVVPHLLFLQELWKKQPALADDPHVKHHLADLTWRVAWYFTERGSPAGDVEGLLLCSHKLCESEPSSRRSDTHSHALFALSAIYNFENNPVLALDYARMNLDIVSAMNIDIRTSQLLALAHNRVGWSLNCCDKWEDAANSFRNSIKLYNECLEVKERGYRPEFPWCGLATALCEMGSYDEAAQILWESIKHREKKYGPADTESIKLGWAMQGLGRVRLKQQRFDESFDAYQSALANYKAASGPRYFRTGQVYTKLGEHYSLRRQFEEADLHFQQALAVFQDRKAYKGECARILHLQAKVYESMGASEATIHELQSQAFKLYKVAVESGRLAVYGASLDDVDYDKLVGIWAR